MRGLVSTETERYHTHHFTYEQLIIKRGQLNHDWDKYLAPDYSIDDLDHEEIRRTIKEGVDHDRISVQALNDSIEQILSNLKLLEHNTLNNAAVALYAKNPKSNFTEYTISLARFKGVDKLGDFIDNKRVTGNIFQLISAAHEFTSRHLPIASYFEADKLQRIDQPAVPVPFKEKMGHYPQSEPKAEINLTIRQEKILSILADGSMLSANEIFSYLQDNSSLRTIKADLTELKKVGLIKQIGKGLLSKWTVNK